MAFGQQTGPPASHRLVQQLLDLIQAAGFESFREARGALGLTQRQAAGKFTADEAAAFIEQLEVSAEVGGDAAVGPPVLARPERLTTRERAARDLPTEILAAELQRRGWIVIEP